MPNQVTTLAVELRTHLKKFEASIDDSLVDGARLAARMLEARREAHLPLNTGQTALEHIMQTMGRLTEARRMTIDGHLDLSATVRQLKVDPVAFGDDAETPNPSITSDEPRRLRAVPAQQAA